MLESREDEIMEITASKRKETNELLVGMRYDRNTRSANGMFFNGMSGITPDSEEAKRLEEKGFMLIRPAELTDKEVEEMSGWERETYNIRKNSVLVIDPNDPKTVDMAANICEQYFSLGTPVMSAMGKNFVSPGIDKYSREYDSKSVEKLQEMLSGLGYKATISEEGRLQVESEIDVPGIEQSSFSKMYDKAKVFVNEAKSKVASIFSKNRTKDKGEI